MLPGVRPLRELYWCRLSNPASDRPLYRHVCRARPKRILELGIGRAQRALRMIALAGEHDPSGRISLSLEYLRRSLRPTCGSASLAYAVLGLAAHDQTAPGANDWLLAAAQRRTLASPHRGRALALLALAGRNCTLLTLLRSGA